MLELYMTKCLKLRFLYRYRERGGKCYAHQLEVDAGNGDKGIQCYVMPNCEPTSLNPVTESQCGLSCAQGYKAVPVPIEGVIVETCVFAFDYENLCGGGDNRVIERSVENVRTPIVLDPVVTYVIFERTCLRIGLWRSLEKAKSFD